MNPMKIMVDAGRRIADVVQVHVGSHSMRVKVKYYDARDGGNIERWVDIADLEVPPAVRGLMDIYQYVAEAAVRTKGDTP